MDEASSSEKSANFKSLAEYDYETVIQELKSVKESNAKEIENFDEELFRLYKIDVEEENATGDGVVRKEKSLNQMPNEKENLSLKKETTNFKREIENLQKENLKYTQNVQKMEDEIKLLTSSSKHQMENYLKLEQANKKLLEENDKLKKDLAECEEKLLVQNKPTIEQLIARITTTYLKLVNHVSSYSVNINEYLDQRTKAQESINITNIEIHDKEKEIEKLQKKVKKMEKDIRLNMDMLAEFQKQLDMPELSDEIDNDIIEKIPETIRKIEDMKITLGTLEDYIHIQEASMAELEEFQKVYEEQLHEINLKYKLWKDNEIQLKDQISQMKNIISFLQKEENKMISNEPPGIKI